MCEKQVKNEFTCFFYGICAIIVKDKFKGGSSMKKNFIDCDDACNVRIFCLLRQRRQRA